MKQKYSKLIKDLQFNAWMRSDDVIQQVEISPFYNHSIGGYEMIINTIDIGEYELMITLNWYWATSDVNSKEEIPILASSHMRHEFSFCDLNRSEILSSRLPVIVFPSSPRLIFFIFIIFIFY